MTVYVYLAFREIKHPNDRADGRRLARAIMSDKTVDISALNCERYIVCSFLPFSVCL